jgi:hypothetical protein
LRLTNVSGLTPHVRDFHSLASFKELYSSFRAHTQVFRNTGFRTTIQQIISILQQNKS